MAPSTPYYYIIYIFIYIGRVGRAKVGFMAYYIPLIRLPYLVPYLELP